MTDHKAKGAPAPENSDKNKEEVQEPQGVGITVSGISGTKTLRVGRVNKRPKEMTAEMTESKPEAAGEAPAPAPAVQTEKAQPAAVRPESHG